LSSEQNVQECDATKDDSSTDVWNKKIYNEEIASASPRNKKQ